MKRDWSRKPRAPIFILGTGRSGTTVLGVVLSLHPDISFLNEPKALWHLVVPDEDIIGSYSRNAGRYRLGTDDATPTVRERIQRLYGACLTLTRSTRILDKYPEMIFRLPFLIELFPDARFLLLVRNGTDICRSVETWSQHHSISGIEGNANWWGLNDRKWRMLTEQLLPEDEWLGKQASTIAQLDCHRDRAAVEWMLTMHEGLKLRAEYGNVIMRVNYEDLTREPVSTLSAVMDFCHLAPDDRVLEYGADVIAHRERRDENDLGLNPAIAEAFSATMERLGYGRI